MGYHPPRRKRLPPRTPRQQQTRMARRRQPRARKPDGLDVQAVLKSATDAVRQAWERHGDATP